MAALNHANIVQVYEVGECDGKPFISLEYVEGGGSLARKLNGKPMQAREAAALVETLARAMHFAHQKPIIHRDLKPANILLTSDGTPKIADFGLAKRMDTADDKTPTRDIAGYAAAHMAPEQAQGKVKEVGPAADVYSLGAILYECLAGQPLFKEAAGLALMFRIITVPPKLARRLQTPRDLKIICLKCLEKERGLRYPSAEALAEDLKRYLDGEPIKARPTPWWERSWKWARRHPVGARMLLLLAAVVTTASVLLLILLSAWSTADENGKALKQSRDWVDKKRPEWAHFDAERSDSEYLKDNVLDSVSWMMRAWEEAPANDPLRPSYLRLLARRGQSLSDVAVLQDGSGPVLCGMRAASFSWDGRSVATASQDGFARVWDIQRGNEPHVFRHGQVGPVDVESAIRTRQMLNEKDDDAEPLPQNDVAWSVKLSPDGRTVVLAIANTALLYDAQSGKLLHNLLPHDHDDLAWVDELVWSASFSRDGRTVVTAIGDKTARLQWDVASGKELHCLSHEGPVLAASFSRDGRTIVTASGDKTARLWDVASGKELCRFLHDAQVNAASISPDGRTVVTAIGDKTARLWDAESGEELQSLQHYDAVLGASFSPDGRTVVTASADKPARLWDAQSGKELHLLLHEGPVYAASFSPDGRTVVTTSGDETARLWDVASGNELLRRPHKGWVNASFSPDGSTVLIASDYKEQYACGMSGFSPSQMTWSRTVYGPGCCSAPVRISRTKARCVP